MEKNSHIKLDLVKLLKLLIKDKKMIIVYCLAGAVFGVIVAFSIPRIYKASVMLAPETSNTGLMSSFSSLASMVGLDANSNLSGDAIYPEIYPDLMGSMDFLVSMFPVKVKSQDGKINTTYYDYLDKYQKTAWWNYPLMWLGKLTQKSSDQPQQGDRVNPFRLSKKQYNIAKSINQQIVCTVDKKTNVISIEVEAQDPLIAATLADSVKARLQTFITDYKTRKARNDLAYMERLCAEARANYTKARQRYAAFGDANMDLVLESYRSKQEDLENEMQLQYNIYTQVVQQLQLAQAKVQEHTPAFVTLQPATVPVKHSNTPKIVILALWVMIAFLVRLCQLIVKNRKSIIYFD